MDRYPGIGIAKIENLRRIAPEIAGAVTGRISHAAIDEDTHYLDVIIPAKEGQEEFAPIAGDIHIHMAADP